MTAWFVVALLRVPSGRGAWMMGHASRHAVRPIRLWANRRWRWALSILPEPVTIGSERIWVGKGVSAQEREQLGRIADAVDVLRELAPGRVTRMKRIGITLVVAPLPGYAAFIPSANVIALDPGALVETPAVLASVLVHELNHALLDERGLAHSWLHERVERLALVDQYDFGYRLHLSGRGDDARRVREIALSANVKPEGFMIRWKRLRDKSARRALDAA